MYTYIISQHELKFNTLVQHGAPNTYVCSFGYTKCVIMSCWISSKEQQEKRAKELCHLRLPTSCDDLRSQTQRFSWKCNMKYVHRFSVCHGTIFWVQWCVKLSNYKLTKTICLLYLSVRLTSRYEPSDEHLLKRVAW